ncbi:hypothetical protein Psfp_02753 [Pelotomaculum sp. FP]|nr:hypothetical protein Psfp_02753 [Pelotomaculum sp. FP]
MGKTFKDSARKKNTKPINEDRCLACIRTSKETGKVFDL